MKKNTKVLISKLLVLCLVLGLLPVVALAAGAASTDSVYYSISADTSISSLTVGGRVTLTLNAGPNNVTAGPTVSSVSWGSSNTSVATVSGSGTPAMTATVDAVGAGTATITATVTWSDSTTSTATCTVTVTYSTGEHTPTPPTTKPTPEPEPEPEKVSAKATTDANGTAKVEVDEKKVDNAVEAAIKAAAKNNSTPVVSIVVEVDRNAKGLNVALPAGSLEDLTKKDGALAIVSDVAEIKLDSTALSTLVDQADGSTISFGVTPATKTQAQQNALAKYESKAEVKTYDVSMTSNGKAIHSFGTGKLEVSLPYTGTSKTATAYYLNAKGMIERFVTTVTNDGKISFYTTHLSTYIVTDSPLYDVKTFDDVSASNWAFQFVNWAWDNEVTKGTDDKHFEPETICNRAQFVTFLWRAAGSPEVTGVANPFTDVSETEHADYLKAILWAYKNGITMGNNEDGTTFGPEDPVLRGQAVTFMKRYADDVKMATKSGTTMDFTDVVNSGEQAYYYAAILWAQANGISVGNSSTANTFGPLQGCERAEMVTFLYRLFMLTE